MKTMSYHSIPVNTATMTKTENNIGKLGPLCTTGENPKSVVILENSMTVPQKKFFYKTITQQSHF